MPRLDSLGYSRTRAKDHPHTSDDLNQALPWGQHKKPDATGMRFVELQLGDWGRPWFTINFGHIPTAGIRYPPHFPTPLITPENGSAHDGLLTGRLYKRRWWLRWYGQPRWWGDPVKTIHTDVDLARRQFEQVELWFDTGRVGPNIHIVENKMALGPAIDAGGAGAT